MSKDIISIVENSKVTHPIAVAAVNGNSYWTEFLQVIEDYKKALNEEEYNRFLDKSQLDCKISMGQYLQFASEVTIVDYIIRNYSNFINEPRYNGKKNPECSFHYRDRTINIEVKCPDFTQRIKQETAKGVKVYAAERFPNKNDYEQSKKFIESNIKDSYQVQNVDRMDNKLKDYLISAHSKFPTSNSSYFNILVIAVDTIRDMDEWYSYIFGDNGVFTSKTYIKDDYSNVDAVLITNVQHGHMGTNVDLNINCWKLENYVSLLFLDPRKQSVNGLGKYYKDVALNLFGGLTRDFLSFQIKLDEVNDIRNSKISRLVDLNEEKIKVLFDLKNTKDKIIDFQIISEWIKTLK